MVRLPFAVSVAAVLLTSLAAAPAGGAAPADDVFTWRADAGADLPAGTTSPCALMSPDPATPADGPCNVLEYWIGNTDEAVYFRWVMASLEFAELGASGAVKFAQGFGGEGGSFSFEAIVDGVNADAPAATNSTPEAWDADIVWTLDRAAGLLTAEVPLDLLATVLPNGTYVTESFQVVGLEVEATPLYLEGQAPVCGTSVGGWCVADQVDPDSFPNAGHFALAEYGDLEYPPETHLLQASGTPLTIAHETERPTSDTYVYEWSMDLAGFQLERTVEAVNGSATLTIRGPGGNPVIDETLASAELLEIGDGVEAGLWNVTIALTSFHGRFEIVLDALPEPEPEPGDDPETESEDDPETSAENGNGSADPPDLEDPKGLPGPALALFVALLAGLVALRRRR